MSGSPTDRTALKKKLSELSLEQSECTIYRVHRELRDVNSKAYEPEVVAIGPYHRNKEHLKIMEVHKLRNLQLLINRKGSEVEMYEAAVAGLESKARKCYADQHIELSPNEFIEMLVLDGCFIVELVLEFVGKKNHPIFQMGIKKNDPTFEMGWMHIRLQKDLMLFENQIPFFILCKLFDLIKDPEQGLTLPGLLLDFFSHLCPGMMNAKGEAKVVATQEINHILDLIHRSWFDGLDLDGRTGKFEFIDCASGLRETNVKFQKNEGATLLDIRFRDGVMLMAPLVIDDATETLLRNLIAYEQYSGNNQRNFVTEYVTFLTCLINSAKDVELLKQYEIITNMQGDDEAVAKMVNKLYDSVVWQSDRFFYGEICKEVRRHCRKRRNRWVKRRERWRAKASIAAAVLLLLTVIQTVFSILQVVLKK